MSISRSAKLFPLFANETDELRLCEPRLRRFLERPKNDTSSSSSSPPAVCPGSSPVHDAPPFLRGLPFPPPAAPRARPKSQTFTTRPPSLFRPQRMFADLMSLCHTPTSWRYFTALASWCISDRTSSALMSPRRPYKSPPVAYSKAMYMSTDTGTSANVGIQDPRARRGGGVEDAEDLDDVRVVQAVQDDDLAEDPARGVDGLERVRDSLQRDDAPGASVERFAHRTERSAAEEGEEPVPGPDLPRVDVSGVLVLRASRGTERGSSGAGNEGREGRRFGISHPSSERFRPGCVRISAR